MTTKNPFKQIGTACVVALVEAGAPVAIAQSLELAHITACRR